MSCDRWDAVEGVRACMLQRGQFGPFEQRHMDAQWRRRAEVEEHKNAARMSEYAEKKSARDAAIGIIENFPRFS